MIRNVDLIVAHDIRLEFVITVTIGRSRAISTSKIRKITAIKKNRSENGSRAGFLGSNPHSNGDLFSRSSILFLDSIVVSIIINTDNKMVIDVIVAIIVIIYLVLIKRFDWKSNILFILDKLSTSSVNRNI
jgi:hypothetical protein